MNAIPLINNAPRPNINVGSIGSPAFNPVAAGAKLGGSIGGNVMRQNPASMPVNNETQLRQEVNTSIVALKREAFSLENLIAQAAQTLQDINKRLSELEGKQGDYVKKNDVVDSITSGNMNPVTSNAVATSNAMPVNFVTSGNMHSVTSNAVYSAISDAVLGKMNVIYKKATTNLNVLQNLLDFIEANRLEFVPDGHKRKANYLILENTSGGGCHNVLVGSTNANYFSILIISYYHQIVAYNYASGTWSKKSFT